MSPILHHRITRAESRSAATIVRTTTFPAQNPAVPENGPWFPALNRAGDEPPSARETQPFLASSNQPTLPESEILEPSFLRPNVSVQRRTPDRAQRRRSVGRSNGLVAALRTIPRSGPKPLLCCWLVPDALLPQAVPAIDLTDDAIVALRCAHRPREGTVLRLAETSRLDLSLVLHRRMPEDVVIVVADITFVIDRVNAGRYSEISIDYEKATDAFQVETTCWLSELTNDDLGFLGARELVEFLPEVAAEQTTRGRVLLADSDDAILEYVGALLEGVGFDLTTANGPAEAEATLQAGVFSLVLVDLMTDRAAGLEALARMRATDESVPIVLFTSDRRAFDLASADERIRVSGWLPKPFELDNLAPLLVSLVLGGLQKLSVP